MPQQEKGLANGERAKQHTKYDQAPQERKKRGEGGGQEEDGRRKRDDFEGAQTADEVWKLKVLVWLLRAILHRKTTAPVAAGWLVLLLLLLLLLQLLWYLCGGC